MIYVKMCMWIGNEYGLDVWADKIFFLKYIIGI